MSEAAEHPEKPNSEPHFNETTIRGADSIDVNPIASAIQTIAETADSVAKTIINTITSNGANDDEEEQNENQSCDTAAQDSTKDNIQTEKADASLSKQMLSPDSLIAPANKRAELRRRNTSDPKIQAMTEKADALAKKMLGHDTPDSPNDPVDERSNAYSHNMRSRYAACEYDEYVP